MTETTLRIRTGVLARICLWVRRRQRGLSDRLHAAGDERARRHGWQVTQSTGRFGFGTRIYRDPRFDDRRRQLSAPQRSPISTITSKPAPRKRG